MVLGCRAASVKVQYLHGKPTFKGDTVTKGFERENGLLFRIVKNGKKKQQTWAFYNDTTQYDMHVKVTFNAGCELTALGSTTLIGEEGEEYAASVVVHPGETAMFVEGRVNGFKSKMDAFRVGEGPAPVLVPAESAAEAEAAEANPETSAKGVAPAGADGAEEQH